MREQSMLINICGPKPARASALVRCKYILGAFLVGVIAGRDGEHASVGSHTPCITGSPGAAVPVGTGYSLQPTFWGVDSSSLTISIENQPVWATFNASSGLLSGAASDADVGVTARLRAGTR